jgi:hypothetical protein
VIDDPRASWPTNNLTVARNGSNIRSLAEDLICNLTCRVALTYINSTIGWKVDFETELGGVSSASAADSDSNIIASQVFS